MRRLPADNPPEQLFREGSVSAYLAAGGLMTVASATLVTTRSVLAAAGVLFFGTATAVIEKQRGAYLDDRARTPIVPFLRRLRRGDLDGYTRLLRVLATMDGRTAESRRGARVALTSIAANEDLMDGLFAHARRPELHLPTPLRRDGYAHRHRTLTIRSRRCAESGTGCRPRSPQPWSSVRPRAAVNRRRWSLSTASAERS